jgi:Metallopeptidase toxin 5
VLDIRQLAQQDAKFWQGALGETLKPYQQAWNKGRHAEAIGRGAFEIGSMFFGGGAAGKAGKVSQVAGAVDDLSRVSRVADTASDLSRVGRVADTASDLSRVGRVADTAGDLSRVGRGAGVFDNIVGLPQHLRQQVRRWFGRTDDVPLPNRTPANVPEVPTGTRPPTTSEVPTGGRPVTTPDAPTPISGKPPATPEVPAPQRTQPPKPIDEASVPAGINRPETPTSNTPPRTSGGVRGGSTTEPPKPAGSVPDRPTTTPPETTSGKPGGKLETPEANTQPPKPSTAKPEALETIPENVSELPQRNGASPRQKGETPQTSLLNSDDVEFAGGSQQRWASDLELSTFTGKTTRNGNRAIQAAINENLPDLNLRYTPDYSPRATTGMAHPNGGTQIGRKSLASRDTLLDTIVHEDLHHRWFERGVNRPHHFREGVTQATYTSALGYRELKFYATVARYMRMRGFKHSSQTLKAWSDYLKADQAGKEIILRRYSNLPD